MFKANNKNTRTMSAANDKKTNCGFIMKLSTRGLT